MSLTSHIADPQSPVARFLRNEFGNDRSFLATARRQIREAPIIRQAAKVPLGTIATAADYRFRYYFAVTPHEELVAYRGARRIAEFRSRPLLSKLGYRWSGCRSDRIEIFDKATGRTIWNHLPERN